MVAQLTKRLIFVLTAFAFLGASVVQAMVPVHLPAEPMMAMSDCDQMDMKAQKANTDHKSVPCKSMTLDCLLQMGCFATGVTLAPTDHTIPMPVAYGQVHYALASLMRAGLSHTPDPFPPKTLA